MNFPQGFELFAILAVVLLLFGAKRLPDASRSLGRSLRIFKAETKGLRGDDDTAATTTTQDATYVQTPVAPPAPIVPPAPVQAAPVQPPVGEQPRQP